jgi:hypothetical protein
VITTRSIRTGLLALTGVAVIAAGCGSSAASAGPSAGASAAPSVASAAPSETPAPSEMASPSASSSASTEASPSAAGGPVGTTGRIVDETKGFAVTLPDGWIRYDLAGADLEQRLGAATGNMTPEAQEGLKQQLEALSAAGLTFFAIGPNASPNFATNLNIIALPAGGMTLDTLEQLNVAQLEAMGTIAGDVTTERVTLPAGEALHLRYAIKTPGVDGVEIAPTVDQYLIVGGDQQFIVTFSGLDDGTLEGDAKATVESFELLP